MTRLGAIAITMGLLLTGASARADILYAVTTTGIIASGYDAGAFGGLGNLTGDAFSALEVFDATTGTFTSGPGASVLNPAAASVLLSVGGHEVVFVGNPANNILYLSDALHQFGNNGVNQDEIFSEVDDGAGDFFVSGVASTTLDFLASANLAQDLSYSVPASGTVNFGESLSSSAVFVGSVNTIALTVIPEPASIAVFGAGLALLGWVRRRCIGRG